MPREFRTRGCSGDCPAEAKAAVGRRFPGSWIAAEWEGIVRRPLPTPLCCVGGSWGATGCCSDPALSRKGNGAATSAAYFGDDPGSGEEFASPGLKGATPSHFPLEAQHLLPSPTPFKGRLSFAQVQSVENF